MARPFLYPKAKDLIEAKPTITLPYLVWMEQFSRSRSELDIEPDSEIEDEIDETDDAQED